MMSLLEKMQEMTESLNAEELLANRDKEEKETTGDIKDWYRGFEITCYENSYSEAKNEYHYIRRGKKTVEEMKVVIDEVIEERTRDYINKFGSYENNKDIYVGLLICFEDEKEFLNFYEDIAYEETYRVRVIFELPSEIDEDEIEYWECDREKWDDDIYIELLDTPGAELVNSRIVDVYCIGDKELQELEEYLEEANRSLDLGEITTEYGRELNKYEPTKNKDC